MILVTGAGGQVGSAVLAELRAAGHQVRGVYHSPAKTAQARAAQISGGSFSQPASDAPVSFVDVRDVARVAAHVLTSARHAGIGYGTTGPEALSYDQAAAVLERVLGRPVRFAGLTDDEARAGMLRAGLPEFHVDALVKVGRAHRTAGRGASRPPCTTSPAVLRSASSSSSAITAWSSPDVRPRSFGQPTSERALAGGTWPAACPGGTWPAAWPGGT